MEQPRNSQNVSEKQQAYARKLFWNRLLLGAIAAGLVLIAVKGANSKSWRKWTGADE